MNDSKLVWRELGNKISVSQFASSEVVSKDGFGSSKIYVKKFAALNEEPNKKITIFLLHDIGQYHGRFNELINWTRENNPGVSFIAMDFVGHGLSSGTRGHFEKIEHLVNDFMYLLTHLKKDHQNNEKWMILGHGLGGLVALDFLSRFQLTIENQIDGIILSNFILKFASNLLQFEEFAISGRNVMRKLISHSRPYRLYIGDQVLSCPDAILTYEQDPLVIHRPTLNSIKEVHKKMTSIYQDCYFLDKPLMLLKSEKGAILQGKGISYFAKGIKKNLLTEKNYSLMKHDLYNETERNEVFQDITDWMKHYEN